ncbi:hypothetical protein H4R35_000951 [Dimargaris xerosporica]|nr:hypothetical protein H4R35_000951 [Dimargaris xerosporica]
MLTYQAPADTSPASLGNQGKFTHAPPTYDGSQDPNEWLDQLDIYFQINDGIPDRKKILIALNSLRGAAYTWYKAKKNETNDVVPFETIATFATSIRAQFQSVTDKQVAEVELASLTQTGSVEAYDCQFQLLTLHIQDINDGEK